MTEPSAAGALGVTVCVALPTDTVWDDPGTMVTCVEAGAEVDGAGGVTGADEPPPVAGALAVVALAVSE